MHIQLPQQITDSYKIVHISHPARGDSDSGEQSPANFKGVDFHPGPALRKAHSIEHIDIEARRGPTSREHSLTKHSSTKDLPGPDSRDRSTAQPSRGIDSSIAHIELHMKVILLVEAQIQGIAQQHTQVVCQILQIKLKRPILKANTHQGI